MAAVGVVAHSPTLIFVPSDREKGRRAQRRVLSDSRGVSKIGVE
jgi:hypothetical protein